MASVDAAALLSGVKWTEDAYYLKEFTKKVAPLPQVAKVIKGQYLTVGAPSLPNPGLHNTLLLVSGGKRVKVAAQCVKFKEGRRLVTVGPKLTIPDCYDGFFEILSEGGRSVRCMESVSELAKRFPDSCIVRENIKAFVSKSDDLETVTEKFRTIHVGETLVLVGEVVGTKAKGPNRFLRCFDSKGENVYLPYDQKGKFSAIAKEDSIGGVHNMRNLLNKRLPLMVRLVHGKPPAGVKIGSQFVPEMRLFIKYEEETVLALPLLKESHVVAIPQTAPLKLQAAKDREALTQLKEFVRLTDRCVKLAEEVADRIQVIDINLSKELRIDGNHWRAFGHFQMKRSVSDLQIHSVGLTASSPPPPTPTNENDAPEIGDYDEIDEIYDYVRGFAPPPKNLRSPLRSAGLKFTNPRMNMALSKRLSSDKPPEPPPIETIPTRKINGTHHHPTAQIPFKVDKVPKGDKRESRLDKKERCAEKRSRKPSEKSKEVTSPSRESDKLAVNNNNNNSIHNNKLFVKAANQRNVQRARIFRHKSVSPLKEPSCGSIRSPLMNMNGTVKSSSPSPIFNMRYKSLTNLACMDFDTLDSSQSGGRTSGDSGGSAAIRAKLPEKRSRRLSRPRSLTNLAWDGHSTPTLEAYLKPNLIMDADRKLRLESSIYKKDSSPTSTNSSVLKGPKKLGTLYL